MEVVKGILYGMANFTDEIKENSYYVDKTMYIPALEEQINDLIFIHPRCLGKNLLLSMLCAYYDLSQMDYNKMMKLILLDRLDGDGVVRHITEEGKILTNQFTSVFTYQITRPEIILSLLFTIVMQFSGWILMRMKEV